MCIRDRVIRLARLGRTMRLKTAIWVAAYLRRCQVEGASAVVRRRGAEEAGAVSVSYTHLDVYKRQRLSGV